MSSGRTALSDFVAQVARSVAGFVSTFFIARVLGADALGTYTLVIALLFWFKFPFGSISSAVSKRVSEGAEQESYLGAGLLVTVVATVFAVGVVFMFRGMINSYVGRPVAELLAVLVVGNVLFDYVIGSLIGQRRVSVSGWLGTLERVLRTSFQIALVVVGLQVTGLVIGHATSLLLVGVAGFLFFKTIPKLPSRHHLVSLGSYARYSWLGSLKGTAMGWVDTIVLGVFVSTQLVGIYEASWALASLLALSANSIARTLFPEFSQLAAEDNYDAILSFLREALVFVGVILLPGFVGSLILGPELLRIYGPEFGAGGVVLSVLILARTIDAFGNMFMNALNGIDRPDLTFRINGIYVVTNVGLNLLFVYLFGWIGAAIATALAAVVMSAISFVSLSRTIGRPSFLLSEFKHEAFATGVMAVVVYIISEAVPQSLVTTLLVVGVGAVVYSVTLLWVSPLIRDRLFSALPVTLQFG